MRKRILRWWYTYQIQCLENEILQKKEEFANSFFIVATSKFESYLAWKEVEQEQTQPLRDKIEELNLKIKKIG